MLKFNVNEEGHVLTFHWNHRFHGRFCVFGNTLPIWAPQLIESMHEISWYMVLVIYQELPWSMGNIGAGNRGDTLARLDGWFGRNVHGNRRKQPDASRWGPRFSTEYTQWMYLSFDFIVNDMTNHMIILWNSMKHVFFAFYGHYSRQHYSRSVGCPDGIPASLPLVFPSCQWTIRNPPFLSRVTKMYFCLIVRAHVKKISLELKRSTNENDHSGSMNGLTSDGIDLRWWGHPLRSWPDSKGLVCLQFFGRFNSLPESEETNWCWLCC